MAILIQGFAFGGMIYPTPLLQSIGSQISTTLPLNCSIILYFDPTLSAELADYLLGFTVAGITIMAIQLPSGVWVQNIPISLQVTGSLGSPITVHITIIKQTVLAAPDYPAMLY